MSTSCASCWRPLDRSVGTLGFRSTAPRIPVGDTTTGDRGLVRVIEARPADAYSRTNEFHASDKGVFSGVVVVDGPRTDGVWVDDGDGKERSIWSTALR